MEASGVSHIAVCVRDLDKSLEFYRDVLGMVVEMDRMQDTTAGGLPTCTNISGRLGAKCDWHSGRVPSRPSL